MGPEPASGRRALQQAAAANVLNEVKELVSIRIVKDTTDQLFGYVRCVKLPFVNTVERLSALPGQDRFWRDRSCNL